MSVWYHNYHPKMAKKILPLVCALILLLVLFFVSKNQGVKKMVSPLTGISKLKVADNLWFPKVSQVLGVENAPEVTAKGAFFVDTQTGEVL